MRLKITLILVPTILSALALAIVYNLTRSAPKADTPLHDRMFYTCVSKVTDGMTQEDFKKLHDSGDLREFCEDFVGAQLVTLKNAFPFTLRYKD